MQIADNLPLERLPSELRSPRFASAAISAGVAIELGTRGIAPAHLRRMLELCSGFECGLLRVVVDTADHHPSPEEVTQTLGGLVPELERLGSSAGHRESRSFSGERLAGIVESIGSPNVGICLDTVNSFRLPGRPGTRGGSPGPVCFSLHVKDFTIRRAGHMMGFEITGTPAGQGMLDIPWLLDTLRAAGRDPNAILELWPPPETTVAATLSKEEEWGRRQRSVTCGP